MNYFTTALAALCSALQHGISPSGKPGRSRGRWGASDEALCGAFEQSPEGGLLVDPDSLRIIAANAVFRRNLALGDVDLKTIPIVILTTSDTESDITRSYQLHANCYLTKPVRLIEFENLVKSVNDFWLTKAKLMNVAVS